MGAADYNIFNCDRGRKIGVTGGGGGRASDRKARGRDGGDGVKGGVGRGRVEPVRGMGVVNPGIRQADLVVHTPPKP